MESKQLNRILILIALAFSMNVFSQMNMADLDNKKLSVNSKTETRNIIKISDDINYSVYYILNKKDFNLKNGVGTNGLAKIIFFSKKYNKGILVIFEQMTYHAEKSIYNITLHTGSAGNYMFIPSMIIVDEDFNYKYLMKYSYIHLPYDTNIYISRISIQDNKYRCNIKHIDIKGNLLYENIDDILSNISTVGKDKTTKSCDPIVYDMDLRDFFPKKIINSFQINKSNDNLR